MNQYTKQMMEGSYLTDNFLFLLAHQLARSSDHITMCVWHAGGGRGGGLVKCFLHPYNYRGNPIYSVPYTEVSWLEYRGSTVIQRCSHFKVLE